MEKNIAGGCLCGRIRYTSKTEPGLTAVCHCPDCQRQTGTAFSIVVALPLSALSINSEPATFTTTGETGEKVRRCFCRDCGSPIYSQPDAMAGMIFLKAGTLDDTSWLKPDLEMFRDTSQSWCELGGGWDKTPRNPPFS